jgi:hypothetical protein
VREAAAREVAEEALREKEATIEELVDYNMGLQASLRTATQQSLMVCPYSR